MIKQTREGSILTTITRPALISSAVLGFVSPAFAQSVGCADINGFSAPVVQVRVSEQLTGNPLAEGEVITVSASSVSSSQPVGTPVWAFADTSVGFGFGAGAFSATFPSSNTPISETVAVPTGGIAEFGLTEFGPWFTDLNNVTITCILPPPPIKAAVFDLAETSTSHQNQSIRFALDRNIRRRIRGGPTAEPSVTRSNLFLSTNEMNDGTANVNAWVTVSGRAFFDDYDGYGTAVIAGADWLLGASSVVGVLAGASSTDLDDSDDLPISEAETSSHLLGIYGGHGFAGNIEINGYVAYSGVDYDVNTTDFDNDRWLAGLAISDQAAIASGTLEHRVRAFGAWEDFPNDVAGLSEGTTEQYRISVGMLYKRNEVLAGSTMRPWVSLDVEYGQHEDTDGVQSDFVAPRLGIGLSGTAGAGNLSASLDIGRATSDVVDSGIEISYSLSF